MYGKTFIKTGYQSKAGKLWVSSLKTVYTLINTVFKTWFELFHWKVLLEENIAIVYANLIKKTATLTCWWRKKFAEVVQIFAYVAVFWRHKLIGSDVITVGGVARRKFSFVDEQKRWSVKLKSDQSDKSNLSIN